MLMGFLGEELLIFDRRLTPAVAEGEKQAGGMPIRTLIHRRPKRKLWNNKLNFRYSAKFRGSDEAARVGIPRTWLQHAESVDGRETKRSCVRYCVRGGMEKR